MEFHSAFSMGCAYSFTLVFETSIFVIYCIAGSVINYFNVTICAVRT